MNITKPVLIAGGYGVVGQQIVKMLNHNYPNLPILLGGRNQQKGSEIARKFTNARGVFLDVNVNYPLAQLNVSGVVGAVNDPDNNLLLSAVSQAIPYVDITSWTARLKSAERLLSNEPLKAPIIFSSSWMAGVSSLVASHLAKKLHQVDAIDIDILYALKDKAGPNSVEYMERLSTPFTVFRNGRHLSMRPFTGSRKVKFPSGYNASTYMFDTPDLYTLPQSLGAQSVSTRMAFDDNFSTMFLAALSRFKIWNMISGKRFTKLRHALLFNPGEGANHQIVVEVEGKDSLQQNKKLRATINDPGGQTHLTAIGALIQIERILGLTGNPIPENTIHYPETTIDLNRAIKVLRNNGVEIDITA